MSATYDNRPGVPGTYPSTLSGDGTVADAGKWSTSCGELPLHIGRGELSNLRRILGVVRLLSAGWGDENGREQERGAAGRVHESSETVRRGEAPQGGASPGYGYAQGTARMPAAGEVLARC